MSRAPSSFRIVRASLAHLDLVLPLFDAYRQFYRLPSDLPRVRAYLSERLTRGECVIFLAVAGSESEPTPLGFTQLYPSFSSLSMAPLWILYDLFVTPPARRQGVAKALMERARQLALETGADSLILETAMDNLSAQRLYEQLGYQRDVAYYRYSLRVEPA